VKFERIAICRIDFLGTALQRQVEPVWAVGGRIAGGMRAQSSPYILELLVVQPARDRIRVVAEVLYGWKDA
jgi:hypothetical protein